MSSIWLLQAVAVAVLTVAVVVALADTVRPS
jgi:hypothetical protein